MLLYSLHYDNNRFNLTDIYDVVDLLFCILHENVHNVYRSNCNQKEFYGRNYNDSCICY